MASGSVEPNKSPSSSAPGEQAPLPSGDPGDPAVPLIVGIGASAGGLEAFKTFFANTPPQTGMAFVLVQHLSPDHKSLLADLLGKTTTMSVIEAADGVAVTPNCVLVIPPDATMTIGGGRLKVVKPAPPRDRRRPIDTFFKSLAEDQGENAVCVILSGTGSDGTLGVAAIKEHGGFTLAQAEYDSHALPGMPESAAASGQVDDVLAVEAMPARLVAYQHHLQGVAGRKDGDGARIDAASHIATIMSALRARSGHDFSEYKEKTLVRRLQRRMQLLQVETPAAYIERFREQPEELDRLFRELLIGVTQFFRDPAAFDALDATVLRGLVTGRGADDSVRVWAPGCATGQEAYSIAILLREAMDKRRLRPNVQIFGTDVDDRAIATARLGRYPKPVAGVSPERFERWFAEEGDGCCVVPEIREMCVFSTHSIIKHPPFSKLDLISCRNLLIYIDAPMQDRVMRTFHYALKPEGALFLGTSESVSRSATLFAALDKKHRIFRRQGSDKAPLPDLPSGGRGLDALPAASALSPSADDRIDKLARRLMEKYYPPHVVIDRRHQIVRFSGGAMGQYLEPSPGAPSFALFDILRKPLRSAVRTALQQLQASNDAVRQENVPLRAGGGARLVTVIAEPMADHGDAAGFIVLAFQDGGPGSPDITAARSGNNSTDATQALEQELLTTRTQLQSTIDELEIANEEMNSANEEYQSVNEELQSSNEELETAKEEMQSVNEELQTINVEMANKNDQLMQLNSDNRNLLDSTEIATLFLDDRLRIKSFTRGVTDIFHVRDADIGRPITDLVNLLDYAELQRDVKSVLSSLAIAERQVTLKDSRLTFVLRIRPYRTIDNVIDGVVLTFVDITEREAADAALREKQDDLRRLIDSAADAICCIDRQGATTLCNAAFLRMLGFDDDRDVIGVQLQDVIHHAHPDGSPYLKSRSPINRTAKTGQPAHRDDELFFRSDGTSFPVEYWSRPIRRGGELQGAVCTFIDVSNRRRAEAALGESEQQFRTLAESIPQLAWMMDAEGSIFWYNRRWFDYTNTTLEQMQGWGWRSVHHPDEIERVVARLTHSIETGQLWEDTFPLRGADGAYRWFLSRAEPMRDESGKIVRWFGTNTDIEDQRRHEEQRELLLREMDHRVKNLFAIISGVVTLSARSAATPQELASTIQGRLGALASAHLMIRVSAPGSVARQDSTLDTLVRTILAPHAGPATGAASRALIEGPEVAIGGKAVTGLALVLHELATNAAKYGAFSTAGGRVRISWTVTDGKLMLSWRERGGPVISGPPDREGFGSLLARRSVNGQLNGQLAFDWDAEGLTVRLSAEAERLAP